MKKPPIIIAIAATVFILGVFVASPWLFGIVAREARELACFLGHKASCEAR